MSLPPFDLAAELARRPRATAKVAKAAKAATGHSQTLASAATLATAGAPSHSALPGEATCWRDYLEERAAIREHDGGLSCADAEAGALADCVQRWRVLNPLPASGDGACIQCGKPQPDTPVLARDGHAWLHRNCWASMNLARNAIAREAVLAALAQ